MKKARNFNLIKNTRKSLKNGTQHTIVTIDGEYRNVRINAKASNGRYDAYDFDRKTSVTITPQARLVD